MWLSLHMAPYTQPLFLITAMPKTFRAGLQEVVQVQAVRITWPEEGRVESAHTCNLTGLTQDLSQRKKIPDLGNQDACELG